MSRWWSRRDRPLAIAAPPPVASTPAAPPVAMQTALLDIRQIERNAHDKLRAAIAPLAGVLSSGACCRVHMAIAARTTAAAFDSIDQVLALVARTSIEGEAREARRWAEDARKQAFEACNADFRNNLERAFPHVEAPPAPPAKDVN